MKPKVNWSESERWKGLFINNLIQDMEYTSYLELGIGAGLTWNEVSCPRKVGVDTVVQMPDVINCTTDEYFAKNDDKFDVIYIDACHEKTQVLKDYYAAMHRLTDRGILFMHDVCPNKIEDTYQTACGDAFELWVALCNTHKHLFTISETIVGPCGGNDTLGILFKKNHTPVSIDLSDTIGYEYFESMKKTYIHDKSVQYYELIGLLT